MKYYTEQECFEIAKKYANSCISFPKIVKDRGIDLDKIDEEIKELKYSNNLYLDAVNKIEEEKKVLKKQLLDFSCRISFLEVENKKLKVDHIPSRPSEEERRKVWVEAYMKFRRLGMDNIDVEFANSVLAAYDNMWGK